MGLGEFVCLSRHNNQRPHLHQHRWWTLSWWIPGKIAPWYQMATKSNPSTTPVWPVNFYRQIPYMDPYTSHTTPSTSGIFNTSNMDNHQSGRQTSTPHSRRSFHRPPQRIKVLFVETSSAQSFRSYARTYHRTSGPIFLINSLII